MFHDSEALTPSVKVVVERMPPMRCFVGTELYSATSAVVGIRRSTKGPVEVKHQKGPEVSDSRQRMPPFDFGDRKRCESVGKTNTPE